MPALVAEVRRLRAADPLGRITVIVPSFGAARDLVRALALSGAPLVAVAGGVAANRAIRAALEAVADAAGVRFLAPPLPLCTDNAAMIAWAAQERIAAGFDPEPDPQARPRWPLDPTAEPVRGAGVKA